MFRCRNRATSGENGEWEIMVSSLSERLFRERMRRLPRRDAWQPAVPARTPAPDPVLLREEAEAVEAEWPLRLVSAG